MWIWICEIENKAGFTRCKEPRCFVLGGQT
jgi:hypothetical protein